MGELGRSQPISESRQTFRDLAYDGAIHIADKPIEAVLKALWVPGRKPRQPLCIRRVERGSALEEFDPTTRAEPQRLWSLLVE